MKITKQQLNESIEAGIILRSDMKRGDLSYYYLSRDQAVVRLINIAEHIRDGRPIEVVE